MTPVDPGVPSPNDHTNDAIVPSLSLLREAEKLTCKGAVPDVELVAAALAMGATFALDVTIITALVALSPALSVTHTDTRKLPTALNT